MHRVDTDDRPGSNVLSCTNGQPMLDLWSELRSQGGEASMRAKQCRNSPALLLSQSGRPKRVAALQHPPRICSEEPSHRR